MKLASVVARWTDTPFSPSLERPAAYACDIFVIHAGMSRCHACGLRNSECHVCIRFALAIVGARSRSPEDLGRRRIELKVWRRTEQGLQMEEESVVFSNIKARERAACDIFRHLQIQKP